MKHLIVLLMLVMPAIASADYFAKLTWEVPTVRENGSPMPLDDIFAYKIYSDTSGATVTRRNDSSQYYDESESSYTNGAVNSLYTDNNLVVVIEDPSVTEYQVRLVGSRTCVWMTTVDKFAVESSRSKEVCIVINPPDSPRITSDPTNPEVTPQSVLRSNSTGAPSRTVINIPMR